MTLKTAALLKQYHAKRQKTSRIVGTLLPIQKTNTEKRRRLRGPERATSVVFPVAPKGASAWSSGLKPLPEQFKDTHPGSEVGGNVKDTHGTGTLGGQADPLTAAAYSLTRLRSNRLQRAKLVAREDVVVVATILQKVAQWVTNIVGETTEL